MEGKQIKLNSGALLIIALGFLLLLNNFGIISWSVWAVLWRFWPLFLILWGVELAFGKTQTARFISLLLIIVALVLGFVVVNRTSNSPQWIEEDFKEEFDQHLIVPTRVR